MLHISHVLLLDTEDESQRCGKDEGEGVNLTGHMMMLVSEKMSKL